MDTLPEPEWSFPLVPVSARAKEMDALKGLLQEQCVVLAYRADLVGHTYAMPINIASEKADAELRQRGLMLLFVRAVSITCGIVGTTNFSLVCSADATFAWLEQQFKARQGLVAFMDMTYGPINGSFAFSRGAAADVPAVKVTSVGCFLESNG
jgi:hypothetical protein